MLLAYGNIKGWSRYHNGGVRFWSSAIAALYAASSFHVDIAQWSYSPLAAMKPEISCIIQKVARARNRLMYKIIYFCRAIVTFIYIFISRYTDEDFHDMQAWDDISSAPSIGNELIETYAANIFLRNQKCWPIIETTTITTLVSEPSCRNSSINQCGGSIILVTTYKSALHVAATVLGHSPTRSVRCSKIAVCDHESAFKYSRSWPHIGW